MIILLISEKKEIYEITKKIVDNKYRLIWYSNSILNNSTLPKADVVIIHLDKNIINTVAFEQIIKIKGKLGHMTPILTVVDEGSPQDIFTILRAGAYDYWENAGDISKYSKKIDELILWKWYLDKYDNAENTKMNSKENDELKD